MLRFYVAITRERDGDVGYGFAFVSGAGFFSGRCLSNAGNSGNSRSGVRSESCCMCSKLSYPAATASFRQSSDRSRYFFRSACFDSVGLRFVFHTVVASHNTVWGHNRFGELITGWWY